MIRSKIGKRYAIYLPKKIVAKLGIKEGDKIEISVEDDKILIKPIKPFLRKRKIAAEISFHEVEEIGEEISGGI